MKNRSSIWAFDRGKEIYSEEINLGKLKIELVVQKEVHSLLKEELFSAYLTAKDENERRLWSTPIIDDLTGDIKVYPSLAAAITDAKKKLGVNFGS